MSLIATNHLLISATLGAWTNVGVMFIQMPITPQIDVFYSVPPILTIMQTLMSVYSIAQLPTIMQIQMVEYALLAVLIGLTINMRIQEQAVAFKIVQKVPGEIIQQTSVFRTVLQVLSPKIQQENVSLNVLKTKNYMLICFYISVPPSVQEDTLAASSIKLA